MSLGEDILPKGKYYNIKKRLDDLFSNLPKSLNSFSTSEFLKFICDRVSDEGLMPASMLIQQVNLMRHTRSLHGLQPQLFPEMVSMIKNSENQLLINRGLYGEKLIVNTNKYSEYIMSAFDIQVYLDNVETSCTKLTTLLGYLWRTQILDKWSNDIDSSGSLKKEYSDIQEYTSETKMNNTGDIYDFNLVDNISLDLNEVQPHKKAMFDTKFYAQIISNIAAADEILFSNAAGDRTNHIGNYGSILLSYMVEDFNEFVEQIHSWFINKYGNLGDTKFNSIKRILGEPFKNVSYTHIESTSNTGANIVADASQIIKHLRFSLDKTFEMDKTSAIRILSRMFKNYQDYLYTNKYGSHGWMRSGVEGAAHNRISDVNNFLTVVTGVVSVEILRNVLRYNNISLITFPVKEVVKSTYSKHSNLFELVCCSDLNVDIPDISKLTDMINANIQTLDVRAFITSGKTDRTFNESMPEDFLATRLCSSGKLPSGQRKIISQYTALAKILLGMLETFNFNPQSGNELIVENERIMQSTILSTCNEFQEENLLDSLRYILFLHTTLYQAMDSNTSLDDAFEINYITNSGVTGSGIRQTPLYPRLEEFNSLTTYTISIVNCKTPKEVKNCFSAIIEKLTSDSMKFINDYDWLTVIDNSYNSYNFLDTVLSQTLSFEYTRWLLKQIEGIYNTVKTLLGSEIKYSNAVTLMFSSVQTDVHGEIINMNASLAQKLFSIPTSMGYKEFFEKRFLHLYLQRTLKLPTSLLTHYQKYSRNLAPINEVLFNLIREGLNDLENYMYSTSMNTFKFTLDSLDSFAGTISSRELINTVESAINTYTLINGNKDINKDMSNLKVYCYLRDNAPRIGNYIIEVPDDYLGTRSGMVYTALGLKFDRATKQVSEITLADEEFLSNNQGVG